MRVLAVAAACLLVVGCAFQPDPQAQALARQAYLDFRDHPEALKDKSTPELVADLTPENLAAVRRYIPPDAPESVRLMSWNMSSLGDEGTADLRHLYDYGDRRMIVTTSLVRERDRWKLRSFHVQAASDAEMAVNDFTLAGKPLGQLAFLALVVLSPLLMIAALIQVLRRKGLRRKWLWGIVSFIGLFSFQMNWTSGQIAMQWLTIQFIGFGITSTGSGLDPWLLTCTFPLGAILILTRVWARPPEAPRAEDSF